MSLVRTDIHGGVATVTLNRPDKLNALNAAMWTRVGEVFVDLDKDENLRCVVLRGAGDKAGMTASASAATASRRNSLPPSAIKCRPAGTPLSGYKPIGKVIAHASIALAVRTKQLRCGSTGTLIPKDD